MGGGRNGVSHPIARRTEGRGDRLLEQSRVLVLNQTYEPIHICNARRAIRMMLLGKADTIETNGLVIRSETLEFRLPSVIRLRTYVYVPRRHQVPFSKKNVMRRDEHTCQYCGAQGGYLTVDHVRPRSRGGRSTWENVVCSCRKCNAKKGDRTPDEAGLRMRRRPQKPGWLLSHHLNHRLSRTVQHVWDKYLHPARLAGR